MRDLTTRVTAPARPTSSKKVTVTVRATTGPFPGTAADATVRIRGVPRWKLAGPSAASRSSRLLVTLAVMAPVSLGLYSLLDSSNRLTKQESNVAQAQQSSRGGIYEVARFIRQARVGQLYYGNAVLPIYDNAPSGKTVKDIGGTGHIIRKGTDVVEVRGVILGDKFAITSGDVTCSGSCDGTSQMTIILRSTAFNGVVNYPPGQKPSIATKTRPFYLVVGDSSTQPVDVSGKTYLVPLYYVGLVNANSSGTWYTYDSSGTVSTFTFSMNPSDPGAKVFNATAAGGAPTLSSPFVCGAVDDILFFVDEGTAAVSGDTHPSLAMATFDPSSGNYDVQPLVDEVEDFQIAYGVDGADGSTPDGGADPVRVDMTAANKRRMGGQRRRRNRCLAGDSRHRRCPAPAS